MKHATLIVLILQMILGATPTSASPTATAPERETALLRFALPETPQHPAAALVVAEIPADQQAAAVNALKGQPNAVFLTTTHDPVNALLDGQKSLVFSADRPEDAPIFAGADGKKKIEKLRPYVQDKLRKLKRIAPALLISLVPATGYGAYFYLLSSDYMQGAGAFVWEFALTAAIGIYSKEWLNISRKSGKLVEAGAIAVGSRFGYAASEMAKTRWRRTGVVLAAYGLNLVSAFTLMGIGHHLNDWHSDAFAFLFAIFSSSEVVDYHSEHLLSDTKITAAVWARQALFSVVEILSLSGIEPAEIFASGVVSTAVFSYVFKEQAAKAFKNGYWLVKKLDPRTSAEIRKTMMNAEPILKTQECSDLLQSKRAS